MRYEIVRWRGYERGGALCVLGITLYFILIINEVLLWVNLSRCEWCNPCGEWEKRREKTTNHLNEHCMSMNLHGWGWKAEESAAAPLLARSYLLPPLQGSRVLRCCEKMRRKNEGQGKLPGKEGFSGRDLNTPEKNRKKWSKISQSDFCVVWAL